MMGEWGDVRMGGYADVQICGWQMREWKCRMNTFDFNHLHMRTSAIHTLVSISQFQMSHNAAAARLPAARR